MYPIYKMVRIPAPHCPKCKEQLAGNNSMVSPWTCSCGVWKNTMQDPINYTIEKQ